MQLVDANCMIAFICSSVSLSILLSVLCVSVVNFNVLRFALAQAQPVAAEFEFERVAERRGAEAADFDARRDAHLQQSPADFVGADDCERLGPTRRPRARPRRASCRLPRRTSTRSRFVVAEAKCAAVDADDAGRAAADHFQARAVAQAQFFQPANLLGRADELADLGDLAAAKQRKVESSSWHRNAIP